jgi:hypothetical protein
MQLLKQEKAFTLVSVLTWVGAMALLLTSMVSAAQISLAVGTRYLAQTACYALTKSVANMILQQLATGDTIASTTQVFHGVPVQIDAEQEQSGVLDVKIQAVEGNVTNTISFTYDTIAHRLRNWQDNSPGIVE